MASGKFLSRRQVSSALACSFTLCGSCQSNAQETIQIEEGACGFGDCEKPHKVSTTVPAANASLVIRKICESVALAPNFRLVAISDPGLSAVASIVHTDRYILYDREFMLSVDPGGLGTWPAMAVVAHEIGHHINGHTLKTGGSRPPLELDADHFAGFALARMGATQDEALQMWMTVLTLEGSSTHPPRAQRVDAATGGWWVANRRSQGQESESVISANKNATGLYDRVISTFVNFKTEWGERQHGNMIAAFKEMRRADGSVYLYDKSRDISVRLDLPLAAGLAAGYWHMGTVTTIEAAWTPLDPMFWPNGMLSSAGIRNN